MFNIVGLLRVGAMIAKCLLVRSVVRIANASVCDNWVTETPAGINFRNQPGEHISKMLYKPPIS